MVKNMVLMLRGIIMIKRIIMGDVDLVDLDMIQSFITDTDINYMMKY